MGGGIPHSSIDRAFIQNLIPKTKNLPPQFPNSPKSIPQIEAPWHGRSDPPCIGPRPSLKYLKPGALARLRDNRLGVAFARSHRCKADPFPPSLLEIEIPAEGDGQPPPMVYAVSGFVSIEERIFRGGKGPRCLTRKKLIAGRCVRLVCLPGFCFGGNCSFLKSAPSCKTDVCLD